MASTRPNPTRQGYLHQQWHAELQGDIQRARIYNWMADSRLYFWPNYNSSMSMNAGCLQIATGILTIIVNAIAISNQKNRPEEYNSYGFYVSIGFLSFFLISGGCAIGAAIKKTTRLIRANMITSVISAFTGICLASAGAAALAEEKHHNVYNIHFADEYGTSSRYREISLAMGTCLLIVSIFCIFAAFVSFSISCDTLCFRGVNRANTLEPVESLPMTTAYTPRANYRDPRRGIRRISGDTSLSGRHHFRVESEL